MAGVKEVERTKEVEVKVVGDAVKELVVEKLRRYLDLMEEIERLQRECREIKEWLQEQGVGMEEPEKIVLPDGRIVKVSKKVAIRIQIDRKKLEQDFPGVFEQVSNEKEVESYEIRQVKR